jgi:hypothetical protein
MKKNYLSLLFIKLYLKNNLIWFDKLNLKSNLKVKSFYKNDEVKLLNSLSKINNNLLSKFSFHLFESYFMHKIILYFYLKNNYKYNLNIGSFNALDFNLFKYKNKNFQVNNFFGLNYKYNNFFFLLLFNFYFIYFSYFLTLKFYNGLTLKNSKLPNKISKLTLLRSPHIDKKSREQFEILRHKSSILLLNLFSKKIKYFLNQYTDTSYIELSI